MFRYRTFTTVLVLPIILLWCYIVSQPVGSQWKYLHIHSKKKDSIRSDAPLVKSNNTNLQALIKTRKSIDELYVSHGDCIGIKLPIHILQRESWSAINEDRTAFVFSAYVEELNGKIKIVGASTRPSVQIFCQHWHIMPGDNTVGLHVKQASVVLLPEDHGKKYSGAVFYCPASKMNVDYVSLVTKQCNVPLNLQMVKNGMKPQKYQRKFTICLKPLHAHYGRAYELVEWIEFNKILGAEKIVVYTYSIAIETAHVLEHYVKEGFAEIVQWNLPVKSNSLPETKGPVDIYCFGTLPMLQDCFLRNKQHSEFVVNLDVDEFIVPRSNNVTWSEMMTQVQSNADAYIFRNTFFRKDLNNLHIEIQNMHLVKLFRITSLQKFEREDKVFSARQRSKYFARTATNSCLMIHYVLGGKSYVVPTSVGLLHHYRNWQNYNDTSKIVVDTTVLRKYGDLLIRKIRNTWKDLGNVKLDLKHEKTVFPK